MQDTSPSTDYIELRFGPRWTYIGCVRKFIASFFLIGLADKERAEQISVAASELLENAIKYSSGDDSSLHISIRKYDKEVDVCVRNPAEPRQISLLRREFAMITSGNAEDIYLKRMEEAAKTADQSRLGLVRIIYETEARLHLEVLENEVALHAIFPVE
ncbi:MAG TPA: hypothetical protein VH877_29360 [Polyangia bacterium]|jgi:hypothetical protein|nr:hypothetical protein [Polyangia bacterium]